MNTRLWQLLALIVMALLLSSPFTSATHPRVQSQRAIGQTSSRWLGKAPWTEFAARHAQDGRVSMDVIADGRKNPDVIPFEVAATLFLKAMSLSSQPTAADVRRRSAFLKEVKLEQVDQAVFVSALRGVRQELDSIT